MGFMSSFKSLYLTEIAPVTRSTSFPGFIAGVVPVVFRV
jgi:hypothetical protein